MYFRIGEAYSIQRRAGIPMDGIVGPVTRAAVGSGTAHLFEDSCTWYLGGCHAPVVRRILLEVDGCRILCSRCHRHRDVEVRPEVGIWLEVSEDELHVMRVMDT